MNQKQKKIIAVIIILIIGCAGGLFAFHKHQEAIQIQQQEEQQKAEEAKKAQEEAQKAAEAKQAESAATQTPTPKSDNKKTSTQSTTQENQSSTSHSKHFKYIREITSDMQGQNVTTKATVSSYKESQKGTTFVTLTDSKNGASIKGVMFAKTAASNPGAKSALSSGQELTIKGKVDIYKGETEIIIFDAQ